MEKINKRWGWGLFGFFASTLQCYQFCHLTPPECWKAQSSQCQSSPLLVCDQFSLVNVPSFNLKSRNKTQNTPSILLTDSSNSRKSKMCDLFAGCIIQWKFWACVTWSDKLLSGFRCFGFYIWLQRAYACLSSPSCACPSSLMKRPSTKPTETLPA